MAETCNIDVQEIECPECGRKQSWQDVQTDGCLKAGFEDRCECGATLVITAVDWEPTVWVRAEQREQAPATPEAKGAR